MPSLLQINATLNWGSTGRIAEQIALLAEKQGWSCYIAHGARYANVSHIMSFQIGSRTDNYLHAMKSTLLGMHGLGSSLATKRLIKIIQEIEPDIIHLHNIHGYYLNYKILFKYLKKSNIPVVWTFHDCWAMTGQCTHFASVGCEKWRCGNGCNHCPLLRTAYKTYCDRTKKNWLLKKQVFGSIDNLTIVPVSHWLESVVRESYLKDKHIRTIYNGVDTNVFHPIPLEELSLNKYDIEKTKYVMAAATDWSDKKGLSDYCKLAALMPQNTQIVLVGLEEEQCQEVKKYEVTGIKRTNNVEELVNLYNGASVVMNLSYEETFGLTTVEGFACGVPSIVYRATASPELVTPETGIIVEPGDIEGVAKAVEEIISKEKPVKTCRERAVQFFNKEDRFQEYIDLYNELIGK